MTIPPAALAALTTEAPGADGHRQIVRLAVNAVANARGLRPPWPVDLPGETAQRVAKLLADLDGLADWDAHQLGSLREQLLESAERSSAGSWYTPPEAARPLTRAALSTITDLHLDDDPGDVLTVSVLDPACGGGVFLIAAARLLASAYTSLLYGSHHPAPLTTQAVMAEVTRSCIYGIDTDPTAVDLTKSALWLETSGFTPITWLDDNIIIGNALNGDQPPALAARLNSPGPLAILGNPPYKDKAKGAAPWLEARRPGPRQPRAHDELWRPSLDEFRTPGQGRTEYTLSNLYVFFWRWALWRAFETRLHPATIAFLTPSAWLTSPAFATMRSTMRQAADQILIVDLTPEGKTPPAPTRIFPNVTLPLCAAILTRHAGPQPHEPASAHHATVKGTREEKFQQLERLLGPAPSHTTTT
ncbi:N-6 DNA methylase [Streptomyces sp. MNP-20]|uniref:N-6 DNA methylase n=1 Tax=Streptomyces sp. MNP-20 TaxID=2721165 RepID=UPI0015562BA1|nr:N-6 DNA methylase [Streptomyces sp. MNP-20]